MRFRDDAGPSRWEVRLRTSPGDYISSPPPFVPHREENPDPAEEAVVVIARSTQEAILVSRGSPEKWALPVLDCGVVPPEPADGASVAGGADAASGAPWARAIGGGS